MARCWTAPRCRGGKFAVADLPEGTQLKADAALAEPAGALAALDLDDVKPAADMAMPDDKTTAPSSPPMTGLRSRCGSSPRTAPTG